jgi:mono/diheme cytochrome c family protein
MTMKLHRTLTATLALLALAPAARSEEPAAAHPSKLFLDHCAKCHGADGKAQTEDGKKFGADPFADARWHEKKKSKADKLIKSVAEGHGKKMPAFKDKLTAVEIKDLVEKDVLGDWK